jgi:hypothetical protein
MKNHIIISLLILLVGCSTSQKEYDINNINYRYDGYIKKFSDEKVNGKVFQMIDDIQVPLGKMKNGKKDGLWTGWDDNGQKKSKGTYKDGKMDGLWTLWYDNGQKMYNGTFKNGELLSYIAYLENGTIGGTDKMNVIDTIKYNFVCGGVQRRWLSE